MGCYVSKVLLTQTFFYEFKQTLRISLPLIASNLVQASSGFLGTVMIAHCGRDMLAALALGGSVYFTLVVFLFGILSAIGVMIAQNHGADNQESMELVFAQGFILAIVSSVPIILIMWFAPNFLVWTGEPMKIVGLAARYLHTAVLCVVPLALLVTMEQFLIGMSRTKLVLWISLLEVPFEILTCYMFVFGKFGMPRLGVAGIGCGFSIVYALTAVAISIFLCRSKLYRNYKLFSRLLQINVKYLFELVRVGWPIGFMYVIEVALLSMLALMMGKIGSDALAANRIARQFLLMGMMFVFAVSQTTTVRVGYAAGKQDRVGINRAIFANLLFSFVVTFLISLAYVIFAKDLISLDVNIADIKFALLVHYAVVFLFLAGITQIFDNLRFIAVGALRGLKDTRIPMYISFVAFWLIALPVAYLFGFIMHFGGVGLWLGLICGITSGAVMLLIRCYYLLEKVDLVRILQVSR